MTDNSQNINSSLRKQNKTLEQRKWGSYRVIGLPQDSSKDDIELNCSASTNIDTSGLSKFEEEERIKKNKKVKESSDYLLDYQEKVNLISTELNKVVEKYGLELTDFRMIYNQYTSRIDNCRTWDEVNKVIDEIKSEIEFFYQLRENHFKRQIDSGFTPNEVLCAHLVLVIPAVIFMTSILIWLLSITQKNKDGL
ncbi:MAG: hypothetical protein MRERC_1c040 [Mycoplasmataceae bacterium RC_NB112A]|nr:MAG: hypothetical protein MRERC_1c040 [Mycoplasmataceae bacterium RC_NB112A]